MRLLLVALALLAGCLTSPRPAPHPRGLTPADFDRAIAEFVAAVSARDAQGWPPHVGRDAQGRPAALVEPVENRLRSWFDERAVERRLEAALTEAGRLRVEPSSEAGAVAFLVRLRAAEEREHSTPSRVTRYSISCALIDAPGGSVVVSTNTKLEKAEDGPAQ